jgi:hypothetical protein
MQQNNGSMFDNEASIEQSHNLSYVQNLSANDMGLMGMNNPHYISQTVDNRI